MYLKLFLKTLKQLENKIKMTPISSPLQVSIDQTSISDHLIKRTSGDKINAPIQVEIDTLKQLQKVLEYKVDAVLLDNMNSLEIKECIKAIKESGKKIFIEVSGGINYKTLNKYLIKGVDAISIGATIHQATFKNIKLEFE